MYFGGDGCKHYTPRCYGRGPVRRQGAHLQGTNFIAFFFDNVYAVSDNIIIDLLRRRCNFTCNVANALLDLLDVNGLLTNLLTNTLIKGVNVGPDILLLAVNCTINCNLVNLANLPVLLILTFFVINVTGNDILGAYAVLIDKGSTSHAQNVGAVRTYCTYNTLLYPFLVSTTTEIDAALTILTLTTLNLIL